MDTQTVISVVGWSNTGKTTFIERAVSLLSRRGRACAVIKNSHRAPDRFMPFPDPSGTVKSPKDSERFFAAGADTAYLYDGGFELRYRGPVRMDAAFLERFFPEAEYLFCEGPRVEGALVVEAAGAATKSGEMKFPGDSVGLVIADSPELAAELAAAGLATFPSNEVEAALAKLEDLRAIHERIDRPGGDPPGTAIHEEADMERELTITSGGKTVPLNDFVRKIVLNTILGLSGSLSGIDPDEALVIQVGKGKPGSGKTAVC
ncbi:MAG: molybdopterin-guanine dinucleotide biosynthesis protein MobB [Spirochaetes bacterium]|nr:molybdopterin-guanine dinucleotide biosynthesis protein MobB [Spirochaetota bacterium]